MSCLYNQLWNHPQNSRVHSCPKTSQTKKKRITDTKIQTCFFLYPQKLVNQTCIQITLIFNDHD